MSKSFWVIAIGQFCDKIFGKVISDREEFGDSFAVEVELGGRGEAGFLRMSVHEFLHPDRLANEILRGCASGDDFRKRLTD